jgi:hypothetical protein
MVSGGAKSHYDAIRIYSLDRIQGRNSGSVCGDCDKDFVEKIKFSKFIIGYNYIFLYDYPHSVLL